MVQSSNNSAMGWRIGAGIALSIALVLGVVACFEPPTPEPNTPSASTPKPAPTTPAEKQ